MMRQKIKIYVVTILLLNSSFSFAQKFKTSVSLSPGISWYISSNSEVEMNNLLINNKGIDFCFSTLIREDFYFSKVISLGMGINYSYTEGSFSSPNPLSQVVIPEAYDIYKHSLSIHSFDIPVCLKFRTKDEITKGIFFNIGTGISYIIQANRKIDRETGYMGYPPTNITSETNGRITLKNYYNNQIGVIGVLGIGKYFVIKNKLLFCEVKYQADINKWTYPTINDPVNNSFNIKRQCFLLNFGMTF